MNAKTEEPAKNPVPDAQSTKAVTGAVVEKKDPDNDAAKKKELADAAIAKEVESQAEISAAEEKKLEGLLGNDSEVPDDEAGPTETRTFSDAELDARRIPAAMKKILKIVGTIPKETPDEHVIWGAAGQKLVLGDLRELCKYVS